MIAPDFALLRVLATASIAPPMVEGACARRRAKDKRGRGQRGLYPGKLPKSVNKRAKTSNIRQFYKRLGAICGLGIIAAVGFALMKGIDWFVDLKIEALRGELVGEIKTMDAQLVGLRNQMGTDNKRMESRTTTLDGDIGKNTHRISENGERTARMEATLEGTTGRLNRLQAEVKRNTEKILAAGGTPDTFIGGTPD